MRILINDFAGHPFQLQLSRALAEVGIEVLHTYFGANNTPKGNVHSGSGLTIANIAIRSEFKKHSLFARRTADIQYGAEVAEKIRMFRPDIVISANTPLDAQRTILQATHATGGGFVFWLQDILSVGIEFALRKKGIPFASLAKRHYERIEKRLLMQSDAIICIAPEFQTILEEWQIPTGKIRVIENWSPLEEVRPHPKENAWAVAHGISQRFCFLYSGTLGMKHKPELLLALAEHYQNEPDIVICVIAEGAGAAWLREHSGHLRPGGLQLLPFQPYDALSEVLSSGDVLIALLDESCGAFAVPSKIMSYMCVARPLLIAAQEGNLASRTVVRARAGLAVAPTVEPFLQAAEHLYRNDVRRKQFGYDARAYAESTFDIGRIRDNFMEVFTLAQGRNGASRADSRSSYI